MSKKDDPFYSFQTWEAALFNGVYMDPDGSYRFKYGQVPMEYSIGRFDFEYPAEIRNHAFWMNLMNQGSHRPYRALDIGVGIGLEVKMPLAYLKFLTNSRPIEYVATNVNTPPAYQPPPDELLIGDEYPITHTYVPNFLLEKSSFDGLFDLVLASRVLEWSQNPSGWLQKLHESMVDGGITILHTPQFVGTEGNMLNAVDLAKQAGFSRGHIDISMQLDPYNPIMRIMLEKGDGGLDEGYIGYLRKNKFKSNTFYHSHSI